MISRYRQHRDASETLQVVIDDATAERLRIEARARGIEVEQLIVRVMYLASRRLDGVLALDDDEQQ